jgi:hypothetical protein
VVYVYVYRGRQAVLYGQYYQQYFRILFLTRIRIRKTKKMASSSGVAMGAPVAAVAAGAPIPASELALRDLFLEGG